MVSDGQSRPNPYYQVDPPKRSKAKEEELPKSYKNAIKPKRIEVLTNGRKKFVYDCKHCGKETKTDARKTWKSAFCDKKCSNEWQKYGRSPPRFSQAARQKISDTHKELWADSEHRAKRMEAHRKATQTPEYRAKHKKAAKEVASRPEWRKKQSEAHRGKKRPLEVGKKISAAKMGHPVSDETRKKLSDANKGEKNPSYKDGRSSERQLFYRSWIWRKQRERVLERDNRICQGCGWTENEVKRLEGHHIDPLAETDQDWNNYPDDLVVPLCDVCHPKADSQDERMKGPLNGRGEAAKPERLNNPKYRQLKLDDLP